MAKSRKKSGSFFDFLFGPGKSPDQEQRNLKKEKSRAFWDSCETPEPPASEEEAWEKENEKY